MLPSLARYGLGFVFRTLLILAVAGSLFAGGCNFGGGHGGGGNGGGNGGGGGGPVFNITKTHQGNFTQGQQNATYTVTIKNVGGNKDAVLSTLSEQLPSGLTLVSMAGTGWTCSTPAPPTLPNCTRSDPLASGASFPPITVTVNVAANATSPQVNQVFADNNAQASDSTTILPAGGGGPVTVSTSVGLLPPLFAGELFIGNSPTLTINITVTNDAVGDVITAALTMDANTTFNCTTATCGTLGPVMGTAGSGNYTVQYTPPASTPAFIQTFPTLVVNSSLPGAIGSTDFIEVDPAGILVLVSVPSRGGEVYVGASPVDTRFLTVTIYNDGTQAGVAFDPLTGSGYRCDNLSTNQCGTQGPLQLLAPGYQNDPTTGVLFASFLMTYTPPAAVPAAPYDKPLVKVVSLADNTRFGSAPFLLENDPTAPGLPPLWINKDTQFKTALIGQTQPLTARILGDTGPLKTVNWALAQNGTSCLPAACGALGAPTVIVTGTTVVSTVTYTPPSVATTATTTITATSADTNTETDSFSFNILDPTCGTGNERVLNGPYAFLLRGGAAGGGFVAFVGSFTADGAGHVTGGQLDLNTSGLGPFLGATLLTAPQGQLPASSYSVGPDNRGCLTLTDNTGGLEVFRFAVGTLDASSHATQGRIIRFDGIGWQGRSQSGVIYKQDPTSFAAAQFNGTYAFGEEGVDNHGGRFAVAGLLTANGVSTLSNLTADVNDAGTLGTLSGSGTFSGPSASDGRGTASTTATITPPGSAANGNSVFYMVSATHALFMSADFNTPILSGELRKQTGAPFSATALDGKDYVFYVKGIHSGDGGNDTVLGQTTFGTGGQAAITLDENKSGVEQAEQVAPAALFSIGSNGRTTISGVPGGGNTPILYLIDSTSAFLVGTGGGAESGFVEQQVGAPFSSASFSGQFFFGSDAPATAARYQSGTVNLSAGNVTGNGDVSSPSGLTTDAIAPANGGTYCISSSCSPPISTPVGRGIIGAGQANPSIAYAVSGSKIIFMSTGTDVDLFFVQR